jgi:signal transduction histidine kinase/ligand-binding sensor domain-containing protein/DNA-binding response OmpR family regulator
MNRLIILFFVLTANNIVKCQDGYHFRNITTNDGLSNNTVLDICQDKDNRMWIATYNGVTIFDGSGYTIINRAPDKNNIPPGKAEQIKADARGNIWILYEYYQLVRIIDDDGNCQKYSIDRYDNESFSIELNAYGNLILRFEDRLLEYDDLSGSFVKTVKNENPYLAEKDTLKKVLEKEVKRLSPDIKVSSVHFTNGGPTWIASLNAGIFKIDTPYAPDIVNYSKTNSKVITTNEFYSVYEDSLGNIWAGTKDHGVFWGRKDNNAFKKLIYDQPIGTVRAIYKDNKGKLWVGSYNNGLYILSEEKEQCIDLDRQKDALKWNWIRCIYQSTDGYIWVGGYKGLCRIEPETFKVNYYAPGPGSVSNGRIYSIAESPSGNLFIGEWGGLTFYDHTKNAFVPIHTIKNNIRKLLLTSKGELWVGTESSGIYVLDTLKYRVTRHYTSAENDTNGICSNSIFDLVEDNEGNIWIGTYGGLSCSGKSGMLQNVSWVNERLPSPLIYKILVDSKKQLWCSTTQGIAKINIRDKRLRIYDKAEEENLFDFSEGAALKDDDGSMYFGGVNGVYRFYPDSVRQDKTFPKIQLKSIVINGRRKNLPVSYNIDSTYRLSSYQKDISFSLKPILITNPYKNVVAWKLSPVNKHFSSKEGANIAIHYSDLHPGKYELVVKAANADGVWSDEETIFTFEIDKPFWQEVYFFIPVAVVISVILLLIIQFRFNKIKQKNLLLEEIIKKRTEKIEKQKQKLETTNILLKEKNKKLSAQRDQILAQRDHLLEMHQKLEESDKLKSKFFTNISHDIRTPLSLIQGPLKELLRDGLTPAAHIPLLNRMLSSSAYIQKLLNQVLDKKKLEMGGGVPVITQGDIVHTCQGIVESFSDQARQNNVELTFSSSPRVFYHRYEHDKLQQILFNLLTNAVKFTLKNGQIKCILDIDRDMIRLEVRDTGIGIPADRIKYIFDRYYQVGKSENIELQGVGIGLSMVKEFVALLKGKIEVQSDEGNGSSFMVALPLMLPGQKHYHEQDKISDVPGDSVLTGFSSGLKTEKRPGRLLLVEDNHDLRQYLKDLLSGQYQVIDVANGMEALSYLKKHNHIDLIVSDWIMPGMDGIKLCHTLKKKTRFQSIPFVMLSALTDVDNQIEGYMAGIDEYIPKPFDPELLLLKISTLLNRGKQIEQAVKVEDTIQPKDVPVKTHHDKLLEKIMALLEEELANPDFGQAGLADMLGMNPTKLYRKIRELTQMTPNDFIRSVRIKRAEQLLKNKNLIINEISYMVGFNDPKYFSRCFTKEYGMSPSKYRHELLDID